jgi:Mor family transcriptional regulator
LNVQEITLDDLKETHRELAETIGIDAVIKLSETFGGCSLYIPKPNTLKRSSMCQQIKIDYFNGASFKELSRKYGVSIRFIYRAFES